MHHSVVLKREQSGEAKLLVFKSIFVSILAYGHESPVMTERVRPQMQASEMRFLQKIKGVAMFDKLCNTAIRKYFSGLKDLSLDGFGHVSRMPQEHFSINLYMLN